MRRILVVPILATLVAAGCDQLGPGDNEPFETFGFNYAFAMPAGPPNGAALYTVTDPDGVACPGVPDPVSLTLLAGVIQNDTDFAADIRACGELFLVAGAAVRQVRDGGLNFRYRVAGGNNDALIQVDRIHLLSTAVDPTGIAITTTGGLTVGTATTLGHAEVYYIDPFRNFRCEGGGPVWSNNVNRPRATFFEMVLTSQDAVAGRAVGEFRCIARNETDTTDGRLLVIMGGAFSMVER